MAVVVADDGVVVTPAPNPVMAFAKTPGGRNILLGTGVAAVLAVMIAVVLWSQKPEYKVLFSNFTDRDGGAIVTSLQAANIPYKFADGGGAILVPADKVHEIRLKLAAEGLPKGGSIGFELMENQKLGISQFLEQVNFQRALEGELARSIQSIAAVQAARVHLAMPKSTVFVRDQQKPTASVLLNLHPGRSLDPQQVSAIVHLIASSVPDLPTKNVTLVDQAGNLLSENNKPTGANTLDPSQLKYVQEIQQNIARRIESIISPIVGANNVRAEATADIDFSTSEQAAEVYKPNQVPNSSTVRSLQSSESTNGGNTASGVPGALTNQPAPAATAPLTAPAPVAATPPPAPGTPAAAAAAAAAAAVPPVPVTVQRDTTTNYEVDKTIRYVQQPMGGVKRLSVAVVVNYKREVAKDGKVTNRALTDIEKTQITDLVKEAMGYNKDRGDTLNVVNSAFAGLDREELPEVPLWKRPETLELGMLAGRYLLLAIVLALLYVKLMKPMLAKLNGKETPALAGPDGIVEDPVEDLQPEMVPMGPGVRSYQQNLEAAKEMARKDPKVVANIVKAWVGNE